jgi:hypothetical protein
MDKQKLWLLVVEACAETLKTDIAQDDYLAILDQTDYKPHENSLLLELIFNVSDEYIDYINVADYVNERIKPVTIYPSVLKNQYIGEILDGLVNDINLKPVGDSLQ